MITWRKKITKIFMPKCCVFKTNNWHHQNKIRKNTANLKVVSVYTDCYVGNIMHPSGSQDGEPGDIAQFRKNKIIFFYQVCT
jgi:hypothetical protein